MKKLIKFGLGFVVFIILALVIFLSFFLNQTIQSGVETFGPKITQTSFKLQKVDISPFTGKGELKGLIIGNPPGFKTDSAIKLDQVKVVIAPASLLSDRIRVKEVLVDSPRITYEMSLTGSNIAKLKANITEGTRSKTGSEKQVNAPEQGSRKIQIDDLRVINGTIRLSAKLLAGKGLTIPLPDIHLKDIGKEGEGASLSEAMDRVFAAISKNTATAVTGSKDLLGKGLKNTGQALEQTTKTAGEALEKAGEGVKEGASKILGGFKEVFK